MLGGCVDAEPVKHPGAVRRSRKKKGTPGKGVPTVEAERGRFELPMTRRPFRFSRPAHSAALASLRRCPIVAEVGPGSTLTGGKVGKTSVLAANRPRLGERTRKGPRTLCILWGLRFAGNGVLAEYGHIYFRTGIGPGTGQSSRPREPPKGSTPGTGRIGWGIGGRAGGGRGGRASTGLGRA